MTPAEAVLKYLGQQPAVNSYCVAYSGGLDSHVLLVLMAQIQRKQKSFTLRALHIDHGLQSDSAQWADHARQVCSQLNVALEVSRADVRSEGDGPEASARMARYARFADILKDGEHLLLAQHAEDQAETFLLQALRGSGPDGLAGIPYRRQFANGFMGRPLLNCSQESLQAFAQEHQLQWIDDPSNEDHHLDRNYLRLKIMPLLKERWPASTQTLSRSALRSAAASQTLLALAQQDLETTRIAGTTELSIKALKSLPRERAFTVLRLFVRQRGLRMPRLQDLVQVMSNLVDARVDSNGLVNVREYIFRRHRDSLFLLPPDQGSVSFRYEWKSPYAALTIEETGLTLTTALCREKGIRLPRNGTVVVKSRAGGELLKMGDPAFHKAVKKILQESAVPPWLRDSIPLLYIDGRLAAVWGIAVASEFQIRAVGVAADNPAEITHVTSTLRTPA